MQQLKVTLKPKLFTETGSAFDTTDLGKIKASSQILCGYKYLDFDRENILPSMIWTNKFYFRREQEAMNQFLSSQIQMKKYRRSRILQISWKNSREMVEQW